MSKQHRTLARAATRAMVGAAAIAAVLLLASTTSCGEKKKGLHITGIDPDTGSPFGGSRVVITGSGFQSGGATGVRVYFGQRKARVVAFEGDSKLIVEAPAGKEGSKVDVLLVFDDGSPFTYDGAYTYADVAKGFGVDELTAKEKK